MEEILYLIDLVEKVRAVYRDNEELFEIKISKYLNDICLENYSTKEGRINAIKKRFSFKYNIPLYVNYNCILFRVKSKNVVWINVCEIEKIYNVNEKATVLFRGGKSIKTITNYDTFMVNYKKGLKIYSHSRGKL